MKYERKNILRNRKIKILTLISIDILMIMLSYFLGYAFRFYFNNTSLMKIVDYYNDNILKIILFTIIYIVIFYLFRQYNS